MTRPAYRASAAHPRRLGAGVYELRIRTSVEHRIFYVAKFEEAVYVLDCFPKKARRTSQRDLEIGRERYRTAIRERARRG